MKQVAPALAAHLQQEVTTLTWCWRIQRTDGLALGFTALDEDLTIDGLLYKASTGFLPNAIASNSGLEVSNTELNSVLDDDSISERDLTGGKFDNARMELFLVNYLDLPDSLEQSPPNYLPILSGAWGQVTSTNRTFTVEVRSLAQLLQQKSIEQTSKTCRAEFGDQFCRKDLAPLTHALTVLSVSGRTISISSAFSKRVDYFAQGRLTFTSGANDGIEYTIQKYDDTAKAITLFEPPYFVIQPGDTFNAVAGCNKTRGDCKRYGNILNFRGEPDVPGADKILSGFTGQ
ncbi:MAG: DUF2163 domain-containing protein [Thermosynechococcaceae cyanobacterium MS004]|nr:DUF2163 domain-containing protein [Thermosynechococcaceae cyanobacterium MS004]